MKLFTKRANFNVDTVARLDQIQGMLRNTFHHAHHVHAQTGREMLRA